MKDMMGAQMLGMAKRCFEALPIIARKDKPFGKKSNRTPGNTTCFRSRWHSAKIDAMDAYLNQVAQLMNDGEMPVAEISKIKFYCSECIESIASEAMQILVELVT